MLNLLSLSFVHFLQAIFEIQNSICAYKLGKALKETIKAKLEIINHFFDEKASRNINTIIAKIFSMRIFGKDPFPLFKEAYYQRGDDQLRYELVMYLSLYRENLFGIREKEAA